MSMQPTIEKIASLLPPQLLGQEPNPFLDGLDQDMMLNDDLDMEGLDMPQLFLGSSK